MKLGKKLGDRDQTTSVYSDQSEPIHVNQFTKILTDYLYKLSSYIKHKAADESEP